MFIGHFALGFAAKKIAPKTSLGSYFLAAQFLDLLWPIFLLLGIEHVRIAVGITALIPLEFYDYPISHGLLSVMCLSFVGGIVYFLARPDKKAAVIIGLLILSHWFLDLIVHRPDLPVLWKGGPLFGFGLWNTPWAAILIEGLFLAVGLRIYLRTMQFTNRRGRLGFIGLVGLLVVIWIVSLVGPPPPSETAVAFGGLAQWLFVFWAYWLDRQTPIHA